MMYQETSSWVIMNFTLPNTVLSSVTAFLIPLVSALLESSENLELVNINKL